MTRRQKLLATILAVALHMPLFWHVSDGLQRGERPDGNAIRSGVTLKLAARPASVPARAAAPQPISAPVPTPVAARKPKPVLTPEIAPAVSDSIPVTRESSEQVDDESSDASETSQGGAVMGLAGASASGNEDNPLQRYLGVIESRIQRLKEYPPQARLRGQEGTVQVSFRVNEKGRIEDFRITRSAGSALLDRAVERLFARLRLPPPEPTLLSELSALSIPVVFELNKP